MGVTLSIEDYSGGRGVGRCLMVKRLLITLIHMAGVGLLLRVSGADAATWSEEDAGTPC